MRTFKNYLEAEKAKREENGEGGFSLIELIVVVVILGILAAIAIPIFLNIQDQAKQSAADTVAANAATQWAAATAQNKAFDSSNFTGFAVNVYPAGAATLDAYCITATKDGKTGKAGTKLSACP